MATPLTADRILSALRAEGCSVREYQGWRDHNRNHKGAWGPLNGVMMHHTATGHGTDVVKLCYAGRSDLPGPLSQGVITKSGTVWMVGNGRANHAGLGDDDVLDAVIDERELPLDNEANTDGNARFYGFECENAGDGKDPWPEAQYLSMVRAAAALCRAHGWSARSVIGHKEWQPGKVDPRAPWSMKTFRTDVGECLKLPPGKWRVTEPLTLTERVARLEKIVSELTKEEI